MRSNPVSSFTELLQAVPITPTIVGGQAVNLWAMAALDSHPSLRQYLPFTSLDCDILGDDAVLSKLAQVKGWKCQRTGKGEASPVVGYLKAIGKNGEDLLVDVLHSVHGLTPRESSERLELRFQNVIYATLNPISLLKAKIANFNGLDQNERQDGKHVRMLVHCVAFYIEQALENCSRGNITERSLTNICTATIKVIKLQGAVKASKALGIDLSACFPSALRRSPLKKAVEFCEHQLNPTKLREQRT